MTDNQIAFLRRSNWLKVAAIAEIVFRGSDVDIAGEKVCVSNLNPVERQILHHEINSIAVGKWEENYLNADGKVDWKTEGF